MPADRTLVGSSSFSTVYGGSPHAIDNEVKGMRKVLVASVLGAVTVVASHLMAQGRGGNPAVFPAQQRPPGDPAVIERGKASTSPPAAPATAPTFAAVPPGGPNLLRSQVVLMRSAWRADPADRARRARGARHAGAAAARRRRHGGRRVHPQRRRDRTDQGAPPETEAPPPNAIVGDAKPARDLLRGEVQQLPLADRRSCRASARECPKARRCRTSG